MHNLEQEALKVIEFKNSVLKKVDDTHLLDRDPKELPEALATLQTRYKRLQIENRLLHDSKKNIKQSDAENYGYWHLVDQSRTTEAFDAIVKASSDYAHWNKQRQERQQNQQRKKRSRDAALSTEGASTKQPPQQYFAFVARGLSYDEPPEDLNGQDSSDTVVPELFKDDHQAEEETQSHQQPSSTAITHERPFAEPLTLFSDESPNDPAASFPNVYEDDKVEDYNEAYNDDAHKYDDSHDENQKDEEAELANNYIPPTYEQTHQKQANKRSWKKQHASNGTGSNQQPTVPFPPVPPVYMPPYPPPGYGPDAYWNTQVAPPPVEFGYGFPVPPVPPPPMPFLPLNAHPTPYPANANQRYYSPLTTHTTPLKARNQRIGNQRPRTNNGRARSDNDRGRILKPYD